MSTDLWHYTCDHGHQGIGTEGQLLPPTTLDPMLILKARAVMGHGPAVSLFLSLVWLTDLEEPDREGLGLTMRLITCDRTRHRYRVTEPHICKPYKGIRKLLPMTMRAELEQVPHARPDHWWIAFEPVAVTYDPVQVEASR
jgi:hypothetical protein